MNLSHKFMVGGFCALCVTGLTLSSFAAPDSQGNTPGYGGQGWRHSAAPGGFGYGWGNSESWAPRHRSGDGPRQHSQDGQLGPRHEQAGPRGRDGFPPEFRGGPRHETVEPRGWEGLRHEPQAGPRHSKQAGPEGGRLEGPRHQSRSNEESPVPGPMRHRRILSYLQENHPELAQEMREDIQEGDSPREVLQGVIEGLSNSDNPADKELAERIRDRIENGNPGRDGRGMGMGGPRGFGMGFGGPQGPGPRHFMADPEPVEHGTDDTTDGSESTLDQQVQHIEKRLMQLKQQEERLLERQKDLTERLEQSKNEGVENNDLDED